ncbi:MAG: adenosine kinase [Spirochaetes bacterium]|nr:MAG: adenosine kinase [Spirochaetota bacterium]
MRVRRNQNIEGIPIMFDVAGIGSALMDFTIEVDEAVLGRLGLTKGTMQLVDEERSRSVLAVLASYPMQKTPGGSAANTVAGVSVLGGRGLFIGKVGNDDFGALYRSESERVGVAVRLAGHERLTGHAITLITPDGERTFATHLGAALFLRKEDIAEADIAQARILHIEGYLLEDPDLKAASLRAMEIAHRCGAQVSIDLADPALIQRNFDEFHTLAKERADILFVNEEEAETFTGKKGAQAAEVLGGYSRIAVVKLGGKGSIVHSGGRSIEIPSYKVDAVNTNGAGDMYAAGFLYGLAHGLPLERCGRIASHAAALVVAQVGARLTSRIYADQIGM